MSPTHARATPTLQTLAAEAETPTYVGRITSQAQGKKGSRGAIWFVTITHPSWTAGVDSIGASTWLHPGDPPDWIQSKRQTLTNTLLEHAERNSLTTDGLEAYLADLLQGVGV